MIPKWSSLNDQSSPDFEKQQLIFRFSMLDWFGIATGQKLLNQQSPPLSRETIFGENSNGILRTSNAKRRTRSASIIVSGNCEAIIFEFDSNPLKESQQILWQAVNRDLEHDATKITFYNVDPIVLSTQKSYFCGKLIRQSGTDIDFQQLTALIKTLQEGNGKSLLLACTTESNYFVHIADGKIVGVVAVITALMNKEKVGHSTDLTMLNFELHDTSEFYVETYTN
jgi:hypothetical protein